MNTVTVKQWKDISTFDPLKDGIFDVDGTIERIKMVTGKSDEDIDNMPMEELLPTYLDCVEKVNSLVFSKLKQIPKEDGDKAAV